MAPGCIPKEINGPDLVLDGEWEEFIDNLDLDRHLDESRQLLSVRNAFPAQSLGRALVSNQNCATGFIRLNVEFSADLESVLKVKLRDSLTFSFEIKFYQKYIFFLVFAPVLPKHFLGNNQQKDIEIKKGKLDF